MKPKNTQRPTLQKILFTSILGPYGIDTHRSRFKNPMSLLSNQVTRGQMYYTVQMCSRTWAFDMFGANLNADVAILDFPRMKQLKAMLHSEPWDRVGISAIVPNFESLLATYQLVRELLPGVPIDIGGHIANDDQVVRELIERMAAISPKETFNVWRPAWEEAKLVGEASHIANWLRDEGRAGCGVNFVKRDGLEYYRQLQGVGLKSEEAIFAPLVDASFGKRVMGIPVPSTSAGLLVPDVGCPMRCNFCSTSHKFNGRFVQFLKTDKDIMTVANAQADRGRSEMFVMSENFSLDTKRALRLLARMEAEKRPHRFAVFSSANGLIKLGVENIVKLGYSFIWIGLEESSGTTYNKMHGIDLKQLIHSLQAHGVEVLGSTILGFEHHTLGDLDGEVEHALEYECVYNQFMMYMPIPGTGLWNEMKAAGKLKKDFPWPDTHGQVCQNWKHPSLDDRAFEKKLDHAFDRDFERLGPSLYRMMKVHYDGYCKTRSWNHELVQMRRALMKKIFVSYIPFLSAMLLDLNQLKHAVAPRVRELRDALIEETGWRGRASAILATPVVYASLLVEKRRYFLGQRLRRAENPRCHLTLYGEFERRYSRVLPRPDIRPDVVLIPRVPSKVDSTTCFEGEFYGSNESPNARPRADLGVHR